MATIRKTITLTEKLDEWIKGQIARGDFTNDSEYLRDLIRPRTRNRTPDFRRLKRLFRKA